jgi:hypothetical protein
VNKTEEQKFAQLVADHAAAQPLILHSRRFRRNVGFGMKVWRSATRNFDYKTEIEHVELACPSYELTERGPVIAKKEKEEA